MTIQEAYDILGLDARSSSPDAVRKAFRKAVLQRHPDRVFGTPMEELANNEMVRLNVAYEFLRSQSFPKLVVQPPPRQAPNASSEPTASQQTWRRQQADIDPDFEAWRRSTFRDPRKVFAHQAKQSGVLYTGAMWARELFILVPTSAMFLILGIYVVSGSPGIGIVFLVLGIGGLVATFRKLQGYEDRW